MSVVVVNICSASGLMIIIGVLAMRVLTVVFMPDNISSMLHQTPIQVPDVSGNIYLFAPNDDRFCFND